MEKQLLFEKNTEKEAHFECPICFEVPEPQDAVQCGSCRSVFCGQCVDEWSESPGRGCANCRRHVGYTEADLAIQRVIGRTEVKCPYDCGLLTTKSELRDHCRLCPKRDKEKFDFTTRVDGRKERLPLAAGPSAPRPAAQEEQEECEQFGPGALLAAAAVGGVVLGVAGGLIGALIGSRRNRNQ